MKYDAVKIEINVSDTWTDISEYVSIASPISWNRGITGNGVKDRIARPGNISFMLHDTTGAFDPINSSTVLQSGTELRFYVELDSVGRYLWYGKISDVDPRQDTLYNVFASVKGADKLEEYNRPLVTPSITTNKTASEVVDEISSDLGITLTDGQKQYGTMAKTFTSVFDTSKSKQNALGEITKAVISEMGFFGVRGTRDEDDNYIIQVDGRNTRAARGYINIPIGSSESDFLGTEDGNYLATEDGKKIVLNQAETFDEFTTIKNKQLSYGKNIINDCFITVYPKEYSGTTIVVFELSSTPKIEAGETLEMLVKYRDPDQEAQSITARSTLTPVANTDYTANAESDESGADLTDDLSVTAEYSAAEIKYTLENTGATDLYVTKLQARGEGILFYATVKLESEDSTSQVLNGYKALSLNLKYIDDEAEGQEIADAIIANTKDVFQDVEWIEVEPCVSEQNLFACMFLDIGDPIKISLLDASGTLVARKFYINGISWMGVPGNWTVKYTTASQEVTEI